jgi:hypothetical protein
MPAGSSWNIDGRFFGTVDGLPVNCRIRCRTNAETGITEIWVHAEDDETRQSTVSRSPDVQQMSEHIRQEFHAARPVDADAEPCPAQQSSETGRVVSLIDYLQRGRTARVAQSIALVGNLAFLLAL